MGLLIGSGGKKSTCNIGRPGWRPGFKSWVEEDPGEKRMAPPVFWLQRNSMERAMWQATDK